MALNGQARLNFRRVLTLSWSVFAERWVSFGGMMLIAGLLAVVAIGMLFFGCILVIEAIPSSGGGGFYFNDTQTAAMGVALFAEAVAGFAILQIGTAAVTFGTVQVLSGLQPGFRRCLGHGFAVMLPVTGTAAVLALVVDIPLCGLAVGGALDNTALTLGTFVLALAVTPLVASLFLVAVPVAAMEHIGVRAALVRSLQLARGNFLRLFGLLLLFGVACIGVGAALGFLSELLLDFTVLVAIGITVLVGTFAAVLAAVVYVELRRAKDGPGAEEVARLFD